MLNIDVAATAFLEPAPVLKFLCDVLRKPEAAITLDDRNELRKARRPSSDSRQAPAPVVGFILGFYQTLIGPAQAGGCHHAARPHRAQEGPEGHRRPQGKPLPAEWV